MKVTKLMLVVENDESGRVKHGEVLAYLYLEQPAKHVRWEDPHGGEFTADEQQVMWTVAKGESRGVDLGVGTKWERTVWCRLGVVTE